MKLSVALCTYNGAAYIQEQLESIFQQTVPVDEIILCDDGSKDDTVKIAQSLLEASGISFRIIVNEQSLGVAENFLCALKNTTGDYVFTCDQDDVWMKNKVAMFVSEIEKTHRMLYFSDGLLVDGKGQSLNVRLWDVYRVPYRDSHEELYMNELVRMGIVTGAAMCVSRELIDVVDEIPTPFLHDEWFSVIATVKGSVRAINHVTFHYRQHGKNVVGAEKQSFSLRAKRWLSNFKEVEKIRTRNYKRAQEIANVSLHTKHAPVAERCRLFWQDMETSSHQGKWKSFCSYCKNLFAGNYSRFYTGFRGFLRDVLVLFL